MHSTPRSEPAGPRECQLTLVISSIRLLRESLVEILSRDGRHCFEAASLTDGLDTARQTTPALILLDAALPEGSLAATRLSHALPAAALVAFGIVETEEAVLAWVEAGIAGYVPNTASVADLLYLIEGIARGEQVCPSRIAGSLLRRLAARGRDRVPSGEAQPLTRREQDILRLIGAGLSNKDIARRLSISLGTTKSHVHNLLGKLGMQRRTEVMARAGGAHIT
jgi:two-component system, NarL family, nitrate/nitrite response regulator NarL